MYKSSNSKHHRLGFTLIEVMIVVAIIGLLSVLALMAWRNQIAKSQDALRKKDLQRISIAFEDYYSDNECYPQGDIITTCGGDALAPYLGVIPCDPVYSTPYCYLADATYPTCGREYRLLTTLGNPTDPTIEDLGCSGSEFCGWETECNAVVGSGEGFNYGVSSLNIPLANPTMPTPSPSPTPTPVPGNYACQSYVCNNYAPDDPVVDRGCPISFANQVECDAYCPTTTAEMQCP